MSTLEQNTLQEVLRSQAVETLIMVVNLANEVDRLEEIVKELETENLILRKVIKERKYRNVPKLRMD